MPASLHKQLRGQQQKFRVNESHIFCICCGNRLTLLTKTGNTNKVPFYEQLFVYSKKSEGNSKTQHGYAKVVVVFIITKANN